MEQLLPYLMAIIGFLIVHVLNGIKSEIKEVKTSVYCLGKDLRDTLDNHADRLVAIETRCLVKHNE